MKHLCLAAVLAGWLVPVAALEAAGPPGEPILITNERVRHHAGRHPHHHRAAHAAGQRQILWAARPYAVDGDTFRSRGVRYRLQGIDTPERGQPKYLEAKERLQQLLDGGDITIERKARDKYGRTVAAVWVHGQDVAAILKAEGYAKPPAYRSRPRSHTWM